MVPQQNGGTNDAFHHPKPLRFLLTANPGTKANWLAPSHRSNAMRSGLSGFACRSNSEPGNLPCSIWLSTASYADAISSD